MQMHCLNPWPAQGCAARAQVRQVDEVKERLRKKGRDAARNAAAAKVPSSETAAQIRTQVGHSHFPAPMHSLFLHGTPACRAWHAAHSCEGKNVREYALKRDLNLISCGLLLRWRLTGGSVQQGTPLRRAALRRNSQVRGSVTATCTPSHG